MSESSLWKQKIDPAFDRIVKIYLQFLSQVGLPGNTGWLAVEEEVLKLWEKRGMEGWIKRYEKDMREGERTVAKWKTGKILSAEDRRKKLQDYRKWLFKEVSILPEESQAYYRREFAPFYDRVVADSHFKGKSLDDLKIILRDYIANQFTLSIHRLLVEVESEISAKGKEVTNKKYWKLDLLMTLLMSAYDSVSHLVFEKSLAELIKESRNGSREAFCSLLQIDRTVVECDWAQKMIRKAQLMGDRPFFEKMAKAISTSPLENVKEYTTLRMVVLMFWGFGLRKLENNELIELLEGCGIRVQEDPESFRRFINRLIRSDQKYTPVSF